MCNARRYVAIQGSGTYLFQELGLSGRAVSREELSQRLKQVIDDAATIAESGAEVPAQTVANTIFCALLLEQHKDATHFFAKRTLNHAITGEALPTQLWAGFAVHRGLDLTATTVIEVGSGEVKQFSPGAAPVKHDAAPFYAVLAEQGPTAAAAWLDSLVPGAAADSVVKFGTAALRSLPAVPGVEVISQESEAQLEHAAIAAALEMARPAAVSGMEFLGNLGWGNGSAQGMLRGVLYQRDVGLKALMKAMGVDVTAKAKSRIYPGGASEFYQGVAAAKAIAAGA